MASMEPSLNTAIKRVGEVLSAPMDGELILLSLDQNKYFGSGDVGRRIWDLLEHRQTIGDLVARLLEEYEVDPVQCEHDVLVFVRQLMAAKLVKGDS